MISFLNLSFREEVLKNIKYIKKKVSYIYSTYRVIGFNRIAKKPLHYFLKKIKFISSKYSFNDNKLNYIFESYKFKSNFSGKWFECSKTLSKSIFNENEIKEIFIRANKAKDGIFYINGRNLNLKKNNKNINWNIDPLSLKPWPIDNVFGKIKNPVGDLRFCWELARMHHIIWYSQAWKISKNTKWTTLIIKDLDDLINISKFEHGIHWRDGLQLAIRIFSMIGATDICNEAPMEFHKKITPIIKIHAFALSRQLSPDSDITNNHIIGELSALALSGIYLNSFEYYDLGINKLEKELDRQIYKDGIPYEGSVPYIGFILEFLLLLYKAVLESKYKIPKFLYKYIDRISISLSKLVSCRGYIPPIGDGDDGRVIKFDNDEYLNVNEILNAASIILQKPLATQQNKGLFCKSIFGKSLGKVKKIDNFVFLENSGLAHFNFKDIDLWVDCGPTGFGTNGSGGHGHNDTTSIVLHYKDKPVLHDPGWYGYFIDLKARNYFRSTFSHNTVNIDNQEQARLGSIFEIINDCNPIKTKIIKGHKEINIICGHDGYSRLGKDIEYSRTIKIIYDEKFQISILDKVSSNKSVKVFSHLGSNYKWLKKEEKKFKICEKFILNFDKNAQNIEIKKKKWSTKNNVLNYGSCINWQIKENKIKENNKFIYFSEFKLSFID